MTAAEEFQALENGAVYYWSVYQPSLKCETGSTALRAGSGLVLIDPVPLAEPAWKELLAVAPLRAILLTNGNHERAALELRRRHAVPVVTAPATRKDLAEVKPDVILLENELLYGIAAIPIPGATPGETAFYFREGGVLVIGDAVIHGSIEKGLEFLPDKYCADAAQNRASLRKLSALDFHLITFAHGLPVVHGAKEKWTALVGA